MLYLCIDEAIAAPLPSDLAFVAVAKLYALHFTAILYFLIDLLVRQTISNVMAVKTIIIYRHFSFYITSITYNLILSKAL